MVASPILTVSTIRTILAYRVIQCDCDDIHRCIHVDVFTKPIVMVDGDSGLGDLDGPVPELATSFALGSAGGALLLHGWPTRVFVRALVVSLCRFGPIAIFAAALSITLRPVCIRRQ